MGKYDGITDNLPTWELEEPTYQDKVNAKKLEIAEEIGQALSSSSLAVLYKNSREEKERLEDALAKANLELTAITQMLVDQYEIDGITSTRLTSGERVSIHYEPYAVVEDKEKIRQWCLANGYEREMHLNWQTLNGIVKERLLRGEPEPDGVRAYSKTKLSFSRGQNGVGAARKSERSSEEE